MSTRPAWGAIFVGAVLVFALILSPIWLKEFSGYIEQEEEQAPFPDAFYQLPGQTQDVYLEMFGASEQMAIDFVASRLEPSEELEEPNLPVLDPNPGDVQLLLTGSFVTINDIRGADGRVSIFRLSDGQRLIRIETLDAINGPDLHVLLTAYPNPTTPEQLQQVKNLEIDLGPLKATRGDQNYFHDVNFNVDNYGSGSVVLYSTRYNMIFSYASLAPP